MPSAKTVTFVTSDGRVVTFKRPAKTSMPESMLTPQQLAFKKCGKKTKGLQNAAERQSVFKACLQEYGF